MLDVPGGFNQYDRRAVYSKLQHRRAGPVNTSGHDLLFDLYRVEKI
jgi:hypothetical protein